MDELLAKVLDAHGGLARWSGITRIEAEMTIGGPFWRLKGQPDLLASETIEADPHRQHIAMTPLDGDFDRSCMLQLEGGTEHISIREGETEVVDSRDDPRQSFSGFDRTSHWDVLQTAYFVSYSAWTYLTEPYLLTYPGVTAHEIEPWHEGPQVWRRLSVTFPPTIATHSATQTYYYDSEGLLRRLDYESTVDGDVRMAHYTDQHETFGGFVVPTRRRVYGRGPDGSADMSVAAITLDMTDASFT